jgi:hypothetical protein
LFHFEECDDHVFKVFPRNLPVGLQIEFESDWVTLHYNYVNYLVTSDDQFLNSWKSFLNHTIIPTEVNELIIINELQKTNFLF